MPKVKVYAIFMPLKFKGLYHTWTECREALDKCDNGSSFASFKTVAEARQALKCGSLKEYRARKESAKTWMDPAEHVRLPCLVVDAACSGVPGPVEYRGVVLPEGTEVFRHGPYVDGTNNIGEYLAIVTGLRLLEGTSLPYPLYSDSAVAIGWVAGRGYCNTHIERMGKELKELVARAESWMRGPTAPNMVGRVLKWETSRLGEIPADFGRK